MPARRTSWQLLVKNYSERQSKKHNVHCCCLYLPIFGITCIYLLMRQHAICSCQEQSLHMIVLAVLDTLRHKDREHSHASYPFLLPPALLPTLPLLFPPTPNGMSWSFLCLSSPPCSLTTLFLRNWMSTSSQTGFDQATPMSVSLVQLLGRDKGTMQNKFARRTISFTSSVFWGWMTDVVARTDHGGSRYRS